MPKLSLKEIIESGFSLLAKIFPTQTYLYFPLLNAAFIWAVKRREEWREKIFSWKVWLDPERLQAKPDEFVLDFFQSQPDLRDTYEKEIKREDFMALREAFSRLYPIFGLEDPFLTALFDEQLQSRDFKRIVREFEERVRQAAEDIDSAKDKSQLMKGLEAFAREMASLSLELVSQSEVQNAIVDYIKKRLEEKEE